MHKESRLLRIGVLGCGPIAQFAHFDACRKARNAELYAICDAAEDLVARMAAIHAPLASYTSYDAMLADPNIDAVIIATADQFHVPLCLRAITAGKHVLVEKPLGVSVEECLTLQAAVDSGGGVLQVGNNRRFDPGIAFAARFIREELGALIGMKGWYYDSTERYTMTDNLQPIPLLSATARRPAGNPKDDRPRYFLLTHASHLVDTARLLGGPIVGVRARRVAMFGAYSWFVSLTFASGALGHIDMTIAIRGDFEEGFQIHGEFGSVRGRAHLPWYHKAADVECYSARSGLFQRPLGADAYSYKLQIEGFADTILHGRPQQGAGVADGLEAVRTLVAIARSAENDSYVKLADAAGAV
ncbi:MAG TPA: Gfo/Idh/MocA family oxidoreductase [Roseiflexaceae bacterium]|nr:Gfo/Idh/MocA family oxidoreductase [Roseiflexaceae bacterium]